MSHYSQCPPDPDSQSTCRRSQRLVLRSSNSQKPSGLLPLSSYDVDQSSLQAEIEQISLDVPLIEEEPDNMISSNQQLLAQSSINNAERSVENISRVDSTFSSNPVPSREAPSTYQTPPIGTGSPSYAHHGSDALAEGNVEVFGEGVTFPESTFDCSIFNHVTLAESRVRNDHHWALRMIGSWFKYKQGELDDLESNPSNLWRILRMVIGHKNSNGDVVIPSSTSSVIRNYISLCILTIAPMNMTFFLLNPSSLPSRRE